MALPHKLNISPPLHYDFSFLLLLKITYSNVNVNNSNYKITSNLITRKKDLTKIYDKINYKIIELNLNEFKF